jgi:hypothetical protein
LESSRAPDSAWLSAASGKPSDARSGEEDGKDEDEEEGKEEGEAAAFSTCARRASTARRRSWCVGACKPASISPTAAAVVAIGVRSSITQWRAQRG